MNRVPVTVGALVAVLAAAGAVRAAGLAGALGALQPGSRPAPALGGDPFRSPLADGSGWWAHPALVEPGGQRFEAGWSAPVRGASSADGRSLAMWGARSAGWRGRTLRVAAGASRLDRSDRVGGDTGTVRLDAAGARVEAALRAGGVVRGLSLQAAGPLWSERGSARGGGAGFGARWEPRSRLGVQAHWERAESPERFASDLHGEAVAASLNLASERWQADARAGLPGSLALEGSVSRSRYRPLAARSPALEYQLEPAGTSGVEQASIAVGEAPLRALARWTQVRFDVRGDARWGGERFGQLAYAHGRVRTWLAGVERRTPGGRQLVEAEHATCSASAFGALESWPFTDPLVDLLGYRRVGRAAASASWLRLHVAGERGIARAWRLGGGVSWYDAKLEGRLESWQPVFLVFGGTDLRFDPLPWRRAQLALVSAGVSWAGPGMRASLELQQPVFARAFETASPAGAGNGSGSAAAGGGAGFSLRETGTELRLVIAAGR